MADQSTPKRTLGYWLGFLPEDIRYRALYNLYAQVRQSGEKHSESWQTIVLTWLRTDHFPSLSDAISSIITWKNTSEGHPYWEEVHQCAAEAQKQFPHEEDPAKFRRSLHGQLAGMHAVTSVRHWDQKRKPLVRIPEEVKPFFHPALSISAAYKHGAFELSKKLGMPWPQEFPVVTIKPPKPLPSTNIIPYDSDNVIDDGFFDTD